MQNTDNNTRVNTASEYINLFVGGVPLLFDERQLKECLESICPIEKVNIIRYNGHTENRGFGFVLVNSLEDAHKLISQDVKIDNKKIDIYIAKTREEIQSETENLSLKRLFIGGQNFDLSDEDFREFFSKFGKIKKGYVIRYKKTKKSKGFGFLDFEEVDDANKVLNMKHIKMDDHVVEVRSLLKKSDLNKIKSISNTESINDTYYYHYRQDYNNVGYKNQVNHTYYSHDYYNPQYTYQDAYYFNQYSGYSVTNYANDGVYGNYGYYYANNYNYYNQDGYTYSGYIYEENHYTNNGNQWNTYDNVYQSHQNPYYLGSELYNIN